MQALVQKVNDFIRVAGGKTLTMAFCFIGTPAKAES